MRCGKKILTGILAIACVLSSGCAFPGRSGSNVLSVDEKGVLTEKIQESDSGGGYTEDELKQYEQLDAKKAEEMGDRPDWYCSFCNSLNSDKAEVCSNCGATRADSEANYFEMLKKKQEREAAELAAQPQAASGPQKKSRSPLAVALVILLAIVAIFAWMNSSKTASDLKVTSLQWARVINI